MTCERRERDTTGRASPSLLAGILKVSPTYMYSNKLKSIIRNEDDWDKVNGTYKWDIILVHLQRFLQIHNRQVLPLVGKVYMLPNKAPHWTPGFLPIVQSAGGRRIVHQVEATELLSRGKAMACRSGGNDIRG